jgi:hypothetical protein
MPFIWNKEYNNYGGICQKDWLMSKETFLWDFGSWRIERFAADYI